MSPRASVVTGPRSPVPALSALRAPTTGSTAVQPTLDEVGTPLHEVTFVVVDLETTGGSPTTSAITEIGAVKVRVARSWASSRRSSTRGDRSPRRSPS